MSRRRSASVAAALSLAACSGRAADTEADSGEHAGEAMACDWPQMIDGLWGDSVEEIFSMADVVVEATVVGSHDEESSSVPDELIVRNVADVRVDVAYKGANEGDTLSVPVAATISNPEFHVPAPAISESDRLAEGATVVLSLGSEGRDGEHEGASTYGSFLVIDGDRVSMTGRPTCSVGTSPMPENLLRATIEDMTAAELRAQLDELAGARSEG